MRRKISALLCGVLTVLCLLPMLILAAPQGEVDSTNLWGSGGQITLNLSECDGCDAITVTVHFDGKISKAEGWGFDSYTIDGNNVIAVVSAHGPNSWAFNNNVGIQVTGSDITEAGLISVEAGNIDKLPGAGGAGPDGNPGHDGNPDHGDKPGHDNPNKEPIQNPDSNPDKGPGKIPGDNSDNLSSDKPEDNLDTGDTTPSPTVTPMVSSTPTPTSAPTSAQINSKTNAPISDDWLTTDGDRIVDLNGNEVWLTGVSWFGYNTGSNIFDGCWSCNMAEALKSIADHGFNLLRVPISAELLLNWRDGIYPTANYNNASNSELNGKNSLEIFEYALSLCKDSGLKVMLDIHSCKTDAMGHNAPLWYAEDFTADSYLEAVEWMAERWGSDDTVIAYDLKNEPHGAGNETDRAIWNDSNNPSNWKAMAEKAGNIILDINPHALIVIEGIQIYPTDISTNNFISMNADDYYNSWWGGNLRGVKDYPIDFGSEARNRQVVYSPHDYGPAVYQQPWFHNGFDYSSLKEEYWYDTWLYIDDRELAPLLIGEWGGFMSGDNLTWMTYLRELIAEYRLNHTFWCFNANSGDTGGLVLDDFTTWDAEKYDFVREVLWQNEEGSFVGLDHVVPLGDNGICLSDFTGDIVIPLELPDVSTTTEDNSNIEGDNEDDTHTEVKSSKQNPQSSGISDKSNETRDEGEKLMSGIKRFTKISLIVLGVIFAIGIGAVIFVQLRKKQDVKHI